MVLRLANCVNPDIPYNCYYCNACGRVNKLTMLHDRLAVNERYLRKMITFQYWEDKFSKTKKERYNANIKHLEQEIFDIRWVIDALLL